MKSRVYYLTDRKLYQERKSDVDDQCLSEAKTDRVLAIYSRLVGGAVLNKADLAQQ